MWGVESALLEDDDSLDVYRIVEVIKTYLHVDVPFIPNEPPEPHAPAPPAEGEDDFDLLAMAMRDASGPTDATPEPAPAPTPPSGPASNPEPTGDDVQSWLEWILTEHGIPRGPHTQEFLLEVDEVGKEELHELQEPPPDIGVDAVEDSAEDRTPWPEYLAKLNMEDRDVGTTVLLYVARPFGGVVLGSVSLVCKNPQNLRAHCRRHKSCDCWLNPRELVGADRILRDLALWLSFADKESYGQHEVRSQALRLSYGHIPAAG